MKLFINRNVVYGRAWGGGAWFVNAVYDNAQSLGHQVLSLNDIKQGKRPDVMLIVGLDADDMGITARDVVDYAYAHSRQGDKILTVLRVNECDARKGTAGVDDAWMLMSQHVDATVFVSNWLKAYFVERGLSCKNVATIVNGVDKNVFMPRSKLNNGKTNVVTHHWSNNAMKGFDIYEELDKFVGQNINEFAFTYIGRDRGTFNNARVVQPLFGNELGNELGKHDVYVSASRYDPGPNHISESIASCLPTYVHKHGGGCVEFAGSDHVYSDWLELKNTLLERKFKHNNTQFLDWAGCVKQYVQFIETL
jgi:glycosyltransferase involved in cell wall biosynthesis